MYHAHSVNFIASTADEASVLAELRPAQWPTLYNILAYFVHYCGSLIVHAKHNVTVTN